MKVLISITLLLVLLTSAVFTSQSYAGKGPCRDEYNKYRDIKNEVNSLRQLCPYWKAKIAEYAKQHGILSEKERRKRMVEKFEWKRRCVDDAYLKELKEHLKVHTTKLRDCRCSHGIQKWCPKAEKKV